MVIRTRGRAARARPVNSRLSRRRLPPAAQAGESFNSERDREAVSQRLIQQYTQTYKGDPARVAVAWFSGPGNVAPAGSSQPFVQDRADPTGKTTSSYVSDVLSRVGGLAGLQTKADFYKANYADILDRTRTQATAQHPTIRSLRTWQWRAPSSS